jgi:hypothetical protein
MWVFFFTVPLPTATLSNLNYDPFIRRFLDVIMQNLSIALQSFVGP